MAAAVRRRNGVAFLADNRASDVLRRLLEVLPRGLRRLWDGAPCPVKGRRRPVGSGGGLTGKRQRGQVGGAAQGAAQLVQCALGEVRVRGNGLGKGQVVVVRLAEVVTCRRRKQARRACEERRVVTRNGTQLVTTIRVVTSDGQTDEEGRTVRGTVDDEEGEMRRRGARECEEALMEATEARRGYARVAAWDEGNLIQAMARLKNPTIAWRYGDG